MVKCPYCDQTFKKRHGLMVHAYKKHPDQPSPDGGGAAEPREPGETPKKRSPQRRKTAEVLFCPCCGTSIEAVALALKLAGGKHVQAR